MCNVAGCSPNEHVVACLRPVDRELCTPSSIILDYWTIHLQDCPVRIEEILMKEYKERKYLNDKIVEIFQIYKVRDKEF